ncbi:unnamed protein product [Parascedosporium putredinis]|uniref:Uncharacterized protein n=1 Tax=Parascedosporium putredinis TaxID=1442378 RepID=A0A9P1HC70_9PEZI|nr:unnamed protein product [Parascedosporium putredinis]CAI8004397.1 unnamed protein product [Parascedosporium putredinis]
MCPTPKDKGPSRYCDDPPCTHPTEPGASLCAVHACTREACSSPRTLDPLLHPESQYCAAHECATPACRLPRASSSALHCEPRHACPVEGCTRPREDAAPCGVHVAWMVRIMNRELRGSEEEGTRVVGALRACEDGPGTAAQEALRKRLEEEDRRLENVARVAANWDEEVWAKRGRRGRSLDSGIGSESSGIRERWFCEG